MKQQQRKMYANQRWCLGCEVMWRLCTRVHAWLHMMMAAPDTSALSCRIALVLHTRILLSCPHVTSLWPDASTSTEKMGVPAA